MAAPVISNEGKQGCMALIMQAISAGRNGVRCRLFQNDIWPDLNTVWGDFVECDFVGYFAQATLIAADQGLTLFNVDVWNFPQVNFTKGIGLAQVAYGYWLDCVNPVTGLRIMLWAQRLSSPFVFINPGDTFPLILTPGFTQCESA